MPASGELSRRLWQRSCLDGGVDAQRIGQRGEIRWDCTFPTKRFAGHRMRQRENRRMQCLTLKTLQDSDQLRTRSGRQLETAAVDRVTYQRKSKMGHMHTNLVRPACLQL